MAKRKLSGIEKETRKYILRKLDEFYHPRFSEREVLSREEFLEILMRDIKRLLEKELDEQNS